MGDVEHSAARRLVRRWVWSSIRLRSVRPIRDGQPLLCHATSLGAGTVVLLLDIVPAEVAVRMEISARPIALTALAAVCPEVSTSSIRMRWLPGSLRKRNETPVRSRRGRPARRRHHSGASTTLATGKPVSRSNSLARNTAGSIPYTTLRPTARGSGTRNASDWCTRCAIACASVRPAASDRRYLRLWTRRAPVPSWANAADATAPSTIRQADGRNAARQLWHKPLAGRAHTGHIMRRPYIAGMTPSLPLRPP